MYRQSLSFLFFLMIHYATSEFLPMQILDARQLLPYKAYRDVQIFHYTVPEQASLSMWQFKSNGSSGCTPSKPISIYLQYGSYPVINPDNSTFPPYFAFNPLFCYNCSVLTNLSPGTINITNPIPGDWYAVAFINDNTDRIAQKDLFVPCTAWLSSTVKFKVENEVVTLMPNSSVPYRISKLQYFKFFAPKNSWLADITVEVHKSENVSIEECPLRISARPYAFPHNNVTDQNDTSLGFPTYQSEANCSLSFIPAEYNWNYILLESLVSQDVNVTITVSILELPKIESDAHKRLHNGINSSDEITEVENNNTVTYLSSFYSNADDNSSLYFEATCWKDVPLVRISLPVTLAFEYSLPPDEDDDFLDITNITANCVTMASFDIFPMADIGGTLVVEVGVFTFMNLTEYNVSLQGCLSYGVRPYNVSECHSGMSFNTNTSSFSSNFGVVLVPYPAAGTWYLTMQPSCYVMDGAENKSVIIPCDSGSTIPVSIRIRSTPCVFGKCGKYGTCYQYISGGFIFSSCYCIAGRKGWGCSDDSSALSNSQLLLHVLLLTLSNMLFIPAIVLALYRHFYTEALVYFAAMFFSAFYHSCDGVIYSFCLMRLSVLQFCDFYSGILSIFVTIIAMANLPASLQSLIHMAGAIGIALGVEYDRTGLWVFVFPTGAGILFLSISWIVQCYRQHKCYPRGKRWLLRLLPGVLLAASGLAMFAFLETQENYAYIHSVWHMIIALSILFLLPDRQYSKGRHDTKNKTHYMHIEELCDVNPVHAYNSYQQLSPFST